MNTRGNLLTVGLAVLLLVGVAIARSNKECLELSDIPIPFAVYQNGNIGGVGYSDGYASIKACYNTRSLKGHAKARGWIPNESNSRVRLRNDPELDYYVEDIVYDYFWVDIDVTRSILKVNRNGRLRYSNRFNIDGIYDSNES